MQEYSFADKKKSIMSVTSCNIWTAGYPNEYFQTCGLGKIRHWKTLWT